MHAVRDKRYDNIRLIFDEPTHKYTDTNGNSYVSTTTLLHTYQPSFDKAYWLERKAKELGISQKRLEEQWASITREACERGTKVHNGIEDAIRDVSQFANAIKSIRPRSGEMITIADIPNIIDDTKQLKLDEFIALTDNKYPDIYKVFKYYTDNGYKIYSEIGGFLIDYLVSGTIDVLLIKDDRFVIGDWKTNRGGLKFEAGYYKKDKSEKIHQTTDIWVKKNEGLMAPLSHMPNCNGSIYNLQLSIYAFMVEQILGIPCAGLWLCHIDSDFVLNKYGMPKRFPDGTYHVKKDPKEKVTIFKLPYRREEVKSIMMDRYRQLQADNVTTGQMLFGSDDFE